MTTTTEGLRIVNLVAENFKRLKAIDITPDPEASTVTIAGRNAQGKSSVIDAIWAALANTAANKGTGTIRPIRDGETDARVSVDLGDLVVTRTWHGDNNTKLVVSNGEGARYTAPQKMLDELIGRLSFDPLSFAQLPAKAQQAELLGLVDLPFDPEDLARRRATEFADRTDVGRQVKQLQGQLAGIPKPVDGLPAIEQSASELLARISAARRSADDWAEVTEMVQSTESRIAYLRDELATSEGELANHRACLSELPEPDDAEIAGLESQIESIDVTNAAIREQQQRGRLTAELAAREADVAAHTKTIEDLDRERTDGLAAAEFPIEGLGFDQGGVTYQGVPFGQASAAEQLRVSVAIAMALNPKVRVIRITDGSLLDSDNLALIDEMAADRGYQVWVEMVRDPNIVGPGVIIEDGQVQA